ncbi:hypothetical protein EVAR_102201_1 [Eumeta japonica]|uniref:Uncharacterized protein n=1 Tax=Eumeta variegata TaxID=151549 RepID=A0A4C1WCZ5_EUMVA|nr:hypothetical protein EVAR_102201_1 [Eumeta japonica]
MSRTASIGLQDTRRGELPRYFRRGELGANAYAPGSRAELSDARTPCGIPRIAKQRSARKFSAYFRVERNEDPYKTTIYPCFTEFKHSSVNLSDEFLDGRPTTAVNNKNLDAVRRMIETDKYITYREVRASLDIGMSRIQ